MRTEVPAAGDTLGRQGMSRQRESSACCASQSGWAAVRAYQEAGAGAGRRVHHLARLEAVAVSCCVAGSLALHLAEVDRRVQVGHYGKVADQERLVMTADVVGRDPAEDHWRTMDRLVAMAGAVVRDLHPEAGC